MDGTVRVKSLVWLATGVVVTLVSTMLVLQTWRADAAPGDTDATFVPIAPCRLVDTRPSPDRVGPAGALTADETRTVLAHGTNGECPPIPLDATGLSLNVTAVTASAPTFLTVWPGGTMPTASSLNPDPGEPPTPNAVATSLSGTGSFNIYNLAGTVDVIVDINGYYTNASLKEMTQQIAALENEVIQINAKLAAQPFAVTASGDQVELLTDQPFGRRRSIRTVEMTAPADGTIVVTASASAALDTSGVRCSITTDNGAGVDPTHQLDVDHANGPMNASIALTRGFEVSAATSIAASLLCENPGTGDVRIRDSSMTAIFTPAP